MTRPAQAIPKIVAAPGASIASWSGCAALALACLGVALALLAPSAHAAAPHDSARVVTPQPIAAAPEPMPFFHLKYADSMSSVNDRCVVTHNRLNPAIHPLYVNGRPVGFC